MEFNAATMPAKPALVHDKQSFTWKELEYLVDNCAANLFYLLGEQPKQQIIAIVLPNSTEYVICYLAVQKLGHIALPIDVSYKNLEIEAILSQMSPQLVIFNEQKQNVSHKVNERCTYKSLMSKSRPGRYTKLRIGPKDQIATLLFTSGTTGKPKAVPNTHNNQIWNVRVCSQVWSWTEKDSLLVSLRLSHMYGVVIALSGCLFHGNTMYLQTWFDPKETLEALSSGKISVFMHVPSAYQEILSYIQTQKDTSYNISSVRLLTSGGGPLPPEVWRNFYAIFKKKIVETYGSSETGRIAGNRLEQPLTGTPGYLFPGVKAKLSDENELLIKSEGLFPGYYRNRSATKAGLTQDGWWKTGDIAELDGGRVILKGRVQEKIRKAGYSISPRDIEWALLESPQIKEVFVMGRLQENTPNDELIYFLNTTLSDKELESYYKTNLLFAWRPDRVIRLHSLPKTASGKVKIPALKKMLV